MKRRYLLIGNEFLLGRKVEEILKRTHIVITEEQYIFPDFDRIIGLAVYEKVQQIIIESELVARFIEDENFESAMRKLVSELREHNINISLICVEKPQEYIGWNDTQREAYRLLCENLHYEICGLSASNNSFYIYSVYGEHHQILSQKAICADIAALEIAEKLEFGGKHLIVENDNLNGKEIVKHQENCIFKAIYKLKPQDVFKGHNVAEIRINLGRRLASVIPDDVISKIDCVCPVPNTGTYYAMGLAEALEKPYVQGLIKMEPENRSFQLLNVDERKKFLWSKIHPIKELIKGKTLAIVDEAIFTGATLKVVLEMLWECDIKGIYLCIPTSKCRYHCDYLVHPPRPMLLEYLSENLLEEYFNMDAVFFQKDEIFTEVMEDLDDNMCGDCFFGGEV